MLFFLLLKFVEYIIVCDEFVIVIFDGVIVVIDEDIDGVILGGNVVNESFW